MNNNLSRLFKVAPVALLTAALLTACNGDSDSDPAPAPEPDRAHDARSFTPVVPELTALTGASIYQGTHDGIHGPASYAIEVPTTGWNGILVMYAHGYRGTGEELTVSPPSRIRQYLISQGYAWAASSYSANYYDVRAGVEDTNALALAFEELTNNTHGSPTKYYITGHSMGGHIAGAAIEAEAATTAQNVVSYSAALPMCGVMADMEQFDYLNSYTLLAQHFAGLGPDSFPATDYLENLDAIKAALFSNQTTWATTAQGDKLKAAAEMLSGGVRPIFDYGFHSAWQDTLLATGGGDGTINGILSVNGVDNTDTFYELDGDRSVTSGDEFILNSNIIRVSANPNANSIRDDGVRWVPVINGEFGIPVLTLHTLGDPYVPFSHQQLYRQAAAANGNDDMLVQRAIRSPSHCDFTVAEEVTAFAQLAAWEQLGVKPGGDDASILDPTVVDNDDFGCAYTNNSTIAGVEDQLAAVRAAMPACPAP